MIGMEDHLDELIETKDTELQNTLNTLIGHKRDLGIEEWPIIESEIEETAVLIDSIRSTLEADLDTVRSDGVLLSTVDSMLADLDALDAEVLVNVELLTNYNAEMEKMTQHFNSYGWIHYKVLIILLNILEYGCDVSLLISISVCVYLTLTRAVPFGTIYRFQRIFVSRVMRCNTYIVPNATVLVKR